MIRTLSSRVVYENSWVSIREDAIEREDGSAGIHAVVDRPDAALQLLRLHGVPPWA